MTKLTADDKTKIMSILVEESDSELTVEEMSVDTNLREDLDMDSIQAVSLMIDLEDWLDIEIEGDDLIEAETVGDLFKLIEAKLEEQPEVRAAS